MQSIALWKDTVLPNEGDSAQAVDERDGKMYWVTRLADGNVWMTQNLDLDIGGTGVAALTSENTDISTTASGSGVYVNGYTENNGIWTWTPASTAITSSHIISGTSISNWSDNPYVPYSVEGGNTYYYTSDTDDGDDIKYTSLSACIFAGHTEGECKHYHAGNYYNWTAAIASNNSSSLTTQYTNAFNSICPKGWRLPIATNANQSIYEFGDLLHDYNITATRTGNQIVYTTNGFKGIRKRPLWFVRSGFIYSFMRNEAASAAYWTGTAANDQRVAYNLIFNKSYASPAATGSNRANGQSVRCLAR